LTESDHRRATPQLRAHYSRVAPLYDVLDWPFEWVRYRRLRRLLCADLEGTVLEAGVGTGRNLAYYPAGAHVTGIDVSPAMLARAARRPLANGVTVELHTGDVTATGFADGHFDAVVASFLICVLPAALRRHALTELARVCHDNGEIRLIEYQRSHTPWRRGLQRLWAPYVRWAFGAEFDVDLDGLIEQAGLSVIESRYVVADIIRCVRLRPA